jgi:hypothetical protein
VTGISQLAQQFLEVICLLPAKYRLQPQIQLGFNSLPGPFQQQSTVGRELDEGGPAIERVISPTAVPGFFNPVNELARASDGNRKSRGNIEDPARTQAINDGHWFKPAHREAMLLAHAVIECVPQLSFQSSQLAE